jgi:hypothetical protein
LEKMSELKTKRNVNRSMILVTLLFTAFIVGQPSAALGAQPLAALVSEAGFDWMAGTWVTTTDRGDTIEVTYKWAVENHVVAVWYKASNGFVYSGLIFYKAAEGKIVHIGADNQGGFWEGTWDVDGRRAIMTFANTRADGQIQRGAAANSQIDTDTMKVETYLAQNGELDDEPMVTQTYTRKKTVRKTGE